MDSRDLSKVLSRVDDAGRASRELRTWKTVVTGIAAGAFQSLQDCFTEDVEVHIYGFQAINGSWKGRDRVLAAIEANFGRIADQKSEAVGLIQDGEQIAMRLRETGFLHETGIEYDAEGVIWLRFREGRICSVQEYMHVQAR